VTHNYQSTIIVTWTVREISRS